MIDVLYRVRSGKNEALRYSLRSLQNVEHGDVHIVGNPPAWVTNVNVIRPVSWRTKWRALVGDLALACAELQGKRLLLIDDDMFILRKRNRTPAMHNGDLRKAAQRKYGAYSRTMTWTADYLEDNGVVNPLCYELHVPLEIDADAMLQVIVPAVNWRRPLQARSLYGNLCAIGGEIADDVKLDNGPLPPDYLSTSAQTWRYWQPRLNVMFPSPSRYES